MGIYKFFVNYTRNYKTKKHVVSWIQPVFRILPNPYFICYWKSCCKKKKPVLYSFFYNFNFLQLKSKVYIYFNFHLK